MGLSRRVSSTYSNPLAWTTRVNSVLPVRDGFVSTEYALSQSRVQFLVINAVQQNFAIPSEAYSAVFLQERIVTICKKGFEIIDLSVSRSSVVVSQPIGRRLGLTMKNPRSMTMPQFDDTRPDLKEFAKRCWSCRPMGLFRANKEEYLLCYDSKNTSGCTLNSYAHYF